jgi:carboxypeptidase Q
MAAGVPVICNKIEDTPDHKFYFTYHHTAGDSMLIMDPDQMDSNVVGIASLLYILADLNVSLRTPKANNFEILNGNN